MLLSCIIIYKNSRSVTAVNRLLDTHVLAHFHTAGALSAPSLHLPLEGKAIHHSSRVFIRDPRARPEAIPESEKAM